MRVKDKKFYEIVARDFVAKGVLSECSVAEAEALCKSIFDSLKETLRERIVDVVTVNDFTFKKFVQKPRELIDLNNREKKIYLPERWKYTVKISDGAEVTEK